MTQWYFHPSAQADRIGPLDDQAARRYAQANPRALAWCQGMSGWTSNADVPEAQWGWKATRRASDTGWRATAPWAAAMRP